MSTLPPPQCKISSVHLSLHSYESFSATLLGSKYILNEATFFGHFQIRTIDEKVLNSDIFLASFFRSVFVRRRASCVNNLHF